MVILQKNNFKQLKTGQIPRSIYKYLFINNNQVLNHLYLEKNLVIKKV